MRGAPLLNMLTELLLQDRAFLIYAGIGTRCRVCLALQAVLLLRALSSPKRTGCSSKVACYSGWATIMLQAGVAFC